MRRANALIPSLPLMISASRVNGLRAATVSGSLPEHFTNKNSGHEIFRKLLKSMNEPIVQTCRPVSTHPMPFFCRSYPMWRMGGAQVLFQGAEDVGSVGGLAAAVRGFGLWRLPRQACPRARVLHSPGRLVRLRTLGAACYAYRFG